MNKLEFIKLANNDLPTFKEDRQNDWIKYGEDNLYPNKLIDLAGKSALHNAIISSKVDACKGMGLEYDGEPDAKTDAFLQTANAYESMNDVYFKTAYDLTIFSGYAIEVILSKDRKSIAEVYHMDFSKIRCGKVDDKNQVPTYWYSKDWSQYRKAEYKPTPIPAYSKTSKEPRQLIYFKEYRPGVEYYPLPSYIGAISYVEIDVEIANFHLSHIKNGMTPSILLNFTNGQPTDDERRVIKNQIRDAYTGTDNAGKFMLTFSDSKDTAPTVETISPAQLDKQFIQLQSQVLANILAGHKVTSPLLVGIRGEGGGLGNNAGELEAAFQLYNNQVIAPMKEQLLYSFNIITNINGMKKLNVETTAPVSFTYSENILTQILTKDELRNKIGYEPINTTTITTNPE